MRSRWARRLAAIASGTAVLLTVAVGPALAGSVSITDPTGDVVDPAVTQNDATTVHTPGPSADITSYSLSSNPTNRTLTGTITTYGPIPVDGSRDPAAYQGPKATGIFNTGQPYPNTGGTYLIAYGDTLTMKNTYTLTPSCTEFASGKPRYDFQNHWQDGYRHLLGIGVEWNGFGWHYVPRIGEYNPTTGFSFYDTTFLLSSFSFSHPTSNSISFTYQTGLRFEDETCVGGERSIDFGNAGDTLASITGMTMLDDSAPQFVLDWANNAGWAFGTGGPYSVPGPQCASPTLGGTTPRNPLFVDGQPCNIINPVPGGGRGFRNSGTSMTY